MLRVIAVDDEKKALERLERVMKSESRITLVGKFSTAREAIDFVKNQPVDIAFLDIEMPAVSGLELAEKLNRENPSIEVIFVTAYDKYALQALQAHAIGYLLKPLDIEEIREQIDNVLRKLKHRQVKAYSSKLLVLCFGQFLAYPAGHETDAIRWRTAKAEELFALLVHYQGKPISKEIIIDTLWPETEPSRAANNFHVTATYLRRALAEKGFTDILLRERDNYLLDKRQLQCDILSFISAINSYSQNELDIPAVEQAVSLYQGPYFANKPYEWTCKTRTWFERQFLKLQFLLAAAYTGEGKLPKAAAALMKLIEQNPLEEEAITMLIALKLQMADLASALRIYRQYEENLHIELGIKPSQQLQKMLNNLNLN